MAAAVTEKAALSVLLEPSAEMLLFSTDVIPAGPIPGWEVVKYVATC